MAANYFLKIIASDHKFFSGDASYLTVPTGSGEMGIMAHHENMIVALVPGELRFTTAEGEKRTAAIGSGIAEIANNRVIVLTDYAELPEEIDAKRAEEALERAKERLKERQSAREYRAAQAAMARALSRLKESKKYYNI